MRLAIKDYLAHICMIIICITPHISVRLLTNSNRVNVWQYQCMSGNQSVREYVLHTKLFFFLFITQIILIVFFSGQINQIYDV